MEGLTTKVYKSVKCYWRRRGYQRLGTTNTRSQKRQSRVWRIRVNPRLKLNLKVKVSWSPRKLFIGLRDAYVNIMMKMANTTVVRGRTVSGYSADGFGKTAIKEYDEKIIIEICKSLASMNNHQQQISSQSIACSV